MLNNIPVHLTSFIGRKREIAEVSQLLQINRLLTLVGAGGSGKTRLAAEVGRELVDAYEDAVFWVELAPLTDPALVPQAAANAIGLRENSPLELTAALVDYFKERKALLIFDNCEHLLAACVGIIDKLLTGTSSLQVLATSRERLQIPGEAIYLVPSLSTPTLERKNAPSADRLLEYEAVRLFCERARSVEYTFQFTDQNAPAVAQVCIRLDGIPLAIELAAARAKILTVEQIAARLDDRFNFLSTGSGSLLPRHQTLRAAIDWSYDLALPKEQILFRRLCIFAGGFTIEAAEDICSNDPQYKDGILSKEVLDLLARLIDKSLVQAETRNKKEARYRILETIRQYGEEKLLLAGEETAVRKRHQQWYLELAERIAPTTFQQQESAWLETLESEHYNLRQALEWSISQENETDAAIRMAAALHYFWHLHGHWQEGRSYLKRALKQARRDCDPIPLAKAYNGAGLLAWDQGDYIEAVPWFEKSLAIWRKLGDQKNMTRSLNYLGAVAWLSGEFQAAQDWLGESIKIGREFRYEEELALALGLRGVVERDQTHYEQATTLLQESIALCRKAGSKSIMADSLDTLGGVLSLQGDYDGANKVLAESLELARELGNLWGASFSTYKLALVALKQRQYPQAAAFFEESLAWRLQNGDQRGILQCLEGLAWLVADVKSSAAGLPEASAHLFGAAEALRDSIHSPLPPSDLADHERTKTIVLNWLGESKFSVAWNKGRAMTAEKAASLALSAIAQIKAESFPVQAGQNRKEEAALHVFSLGASQVYVGKRLLANSDWVYARAKELFFYFLCFPARTKEQIGLDLWPDASEAQLRNNFHRTLYHVRRALGRADWILIEGEKYQFNYSSDCWFDAREFESKLDKAKDLERLHDPEAAGCYQAAITLYHGDFLEDLELYEWALPQRQAYKRKFEDAAFALGRYYFLAGQYAAAEEIYRQLLAQDVFLEEAHRGLMRCLAHRGEHGQALQQYQVLENTLQDELGIQPAPESQALFELLRQGKSL
jgi:predicted ATPase/DNA-binding SARP family transcriptional activator